MLSSWPVSHIALQRESLTGLCLLVALFQNKTWPVLPFFTSCFDKISLGEHNHEAAKEQARSTSPMYRDELSKIKQKMGHCKISPDAEKGRYCGNRVGKEKRVVVRVKVKMTKREATRLLGKFGDGGVLEFRDVACELLQIPMSRVRVVSRASPEDGAAGELKSIPEEDEAQV